MIEVTSMNRPDPSWCFVDAAGHEHRWFVVGEEQPAVGYSPSKQYHVPSTDEIDGEELFPTYFECRQCRERIMLGRTADTTRQFIPGLMYQD